MDISIEAIRKKIDLYKEHSCVSYLKSVYLEIKNIQKSFTLNDYSKELGFGHNNTMAQIHTGHRQLSQKSAVRIAEILRLNRHEKHYFLALLELSLSKTQAEKEKMMALVLELKGRYGKQYEAREELQFFNRWHHSVVFELLQANTAKTTKDIAKSCTMSLSEEEVTESLNLLEQLGLAAQDKPGSKQYIKIKDDFSAGGRVPGMAIIRYHQEMMNLAKASLEETPPNYRDISSVTISVNEELVERLKADIAMFRKYLLFMASQCEDAGKVMQVNIQLFPLNK